MMPLDQAIAVLVPSAILSPFPGPNCVVLSTLSSTPTITYWDSALPTQPTADQLAAVTQDQVTAAQQAAQSMAGGTALQTAVDPPSVANRANAVTIYTRINDVAEFAWAALQLVCQAANAAAPTAAQIQAQITANRTANPVDSGATDPGTVSKSGNQRITQTTILQLISGVLETGGGLPGD